MKATTAIPLAAVAGLLAFVGYSVWKSRRAAAAGVADAAHLPVAAVTLADRGGAANQSTVSYAQDQMGIDWQQKATLLALTPATPTPAVVASVNTSALNGAVARAGASQLSAASNGFLGVRGF